MIVQYIFLWGLILFILFWAVVKIKYPFWNNQPVFHTYDYIRSLYKQPFVVQSVGPYKTKFVDQLHIHTYPVDHENNNTLKEIAKLLQSYYLYLENVDYMIGNTELYTLHTGQNDMSYMSVYQVLEYEMKPATKKDEKIDESTNTLANTNIDIVKHDKTIGCVTSRAVTMYVRPTKRETTYKQTTMYFMDFLCVSREHDNKTISRKLIQTHEYNQRKYNKNIECSLLKKTGEQFDGVRPLITYKTYSYNIPKRKFGRIPTEYTAKLLHSNDISLFLDFFTFNSENEPKTSMFDFMVLPSIGNIVAQIRECRLYVGCLCHKSIVLGFYFLKDAYCYNEEYESKTLTLVSSIQNCSDSRLFYMGFLHVLRDIIHTNADYKAIVIENIGHNQYINNSWRSKVQVSNATDMAYYSYNYVYPCSPIDPTRCFVLL
jgi:hypothetical protein